MVYSEIQDLCNLRKITIKELCSTIGMSYQGLKTSLETNKLSSDKIVLLCKSLLITPNDFFDWKLNTSAQQIQTGCVGNAQYMDTRAVDLLQEQLSIKDKQLCEAQEQISRLINLLSR